jgi:chromosome segregation ATPase
MPPVKNDFITQELVKNLDLTNELVRQLISDLHARELDFAKLSVELNHLVAQFKELSGSLDQTDELILNINLKIAVLEKTVNDIEKSLKEEKQREQEKALHAEIADKAGRWRMATSLAAGVLGIVGSIIAIVLNYLNHK